MLFFRSYILSIWESYNKATDNAAMLPKFRQKKNPVGRFQGAISLHLSLELPRNYKFLWPLEMPTAVAEVSRPVLFKKNHLETKNRKKIVMAHLRMSINRHEMKCRVLDLKKEGPGQPRGHLPASPLPVRTLGPPSRPFSEDWAPPMSIQGLRQASHVRRQ